MKRDEWDYSCPDGAIRHGPLDGAGCCPWCGTQVEAKRMAPRRYPVSELTEAYAEFYDPDYGADGATERQRRRMAGTTYY